MKTDLMTVSPQAGIKTERHLHAKAQGWLPTAQHDKGQLVGIITDSDFVAIAINLLELQEEMEPEEVE